ncbi:MAG: hypothetical protein M3132_00625 [Actinomycetia bacterium]|nr:hypothetical protein [Actinomycetes bacterium]
MNRLVVLVVGIALVAAACSAAEEVAAPTTTVAITTTSTVTSTTTTVAPTTTVTPTTTSQPPSTTTTVADLIETSPVVPGEDPDVDAIVETYLVVFDSTTSFEEKAPFITDASGLEETVDKYASAGDDVGGIALQADEVGIDGTDARVIYSFLFAGNPAYSDLEGEAVFTDAGWQVSREFFCGIMDSARVGCP